jgi:hypothetical protein
MHLAADSLAATLVVAAPLAVLLWLSGAVSPAVALGATTVLVFVVLSAGFLLLRAVHAADMPAPAAWVLGIAASAIAVYALVMAFELLAVSAFAIWAVLVVGLSIAFRPPDPGGGRTDRGLLALLLCAAATVLWCWDLAQVPGVLAREGWLTTWTDQFVHGAVISQFGDPRAAGRQAIGLADAPMPLYHYASYMLPAAFVWPLDLPGFPLATSLWAPVGFLTLCAGAYVLGSELAGIAGGLAALAALTLLPDAASYGLHNGFFGYYWYVLAVPGASYAVGVSLVAIAFLHRWTKARSLRPLLASACLVAASFLVRTHVFLLVFPAWLASAAMLTRLVQRRKVAFFAVAGAAFGLFVLGYYLLIPDARLALVEFLDIAHGQQVLLAYDGLYPGLVADYGPALAIPAGLLLVFPAFLGLFTILYPVSVLLARRSRGLGAIDFLPVAFLVGYLLLMSTAPVPANGDSTELTQRPFVMVYAVIAVWTVTALVNWFAVQGGLDPRRLRLPLLLIAAVSLIWAVRYTDRDWRWAQVQEVTPGLPQAAGFLRSHGRSGDVFAVEGLKPGWVATDDSIQLASLTGMPAYLTRPYVHVSAGGRRKEVALERHAALARVAAEESISTALMRLRELGVHWYVVAGSTGPRWDPQRRAATFVAGTVAVYASR